MLFTGGATDVSSFHAWRIVPRMCRAVDIRGHVLKSVIYHALWAAGTMADKRDSKDPDDEGETAMAPTDVLPTNMNEAAQVSLCCLAVTWR